MKYRLLIIILLTGFCYSQVTAQSGGFQLLSIGPDATSLSLSESVTAKPLSATSLFTNPALLAGLNQSSVSLSHTFWLENSGNTHAAVATKGRQRVFAFGVLTSAINNIEARQTPGEPSGTFDVNYYAFAGGVAQKFGNISIGVTAMYLYEQLYQLSASGYGFNAGVSTDFMNERIRLGAAVLNMGKMEILTESRTPLPTVAKAGIWADIAQFTINGSNDIPILLSVVSDVHVPVNTDDALENDAAWISTGFQVTFSNLIELRAAVRSGDTKRPFSTGMGIKLDNLAFNYAFVPFETGFGLTHSIGLRYYFDF